MTHIPEHGTGRTYCGRDAAKVMCIDIRRDSIESATCLTCQKSDDRRSAELYRREQREERAALVRDSEDAETRAMRGAL